MNNCVLSDGEKVWKVMTTNSCCIVLYNIKAIHPLRKKHLDQRVQNVRNNTQITQIAGQLFHSQYWLLAKVLNKL
jgi:hypothetical protein